ncbi:MAG: Ig-like domain-containing protein [Bacteroidaceae bacterium]|nr:Ig-like domain-containing protein [Bacteroidaceae bacterium]
MDNNKEYKTDKCPTSSENPKRQRWSCRGWSCWLFIIPFIILSCARMGTPDGGPYDETPPVMVSSNPIAGALGSKEKRIELVFDEFIKLEKASEKVVISPPQTEMPEIKTNGKKVIVELMDSLRPNTTYSIDFGDAIVDNNEGNPMGQFAFTFSTGENIDSLAISGTVLAAENLEPVKGMQVGIYADLADSAFTSKPFERVSRTDSRGKFSIKGIAPGTYRIYGLADSNQDYKFDQKNEMIAFTDTLIVPTCEPALRPDTTWIDSLTIDTIRQVPYTRFLPDDIVLLAFKEKPTQQYLVKNERHTPEKFSIYFAASYDSVHPKLTGLNFDADKALIPEVSADYDSLTFWISDSAVYNLDTLKMAIAYLYTDTLNQLVPRTDTLEMAAKKNRAMIEKERNKQLEEFQKELKKRRRKLKEGEVLTDTLPPKKFLNVKISPKGTTDVYRVMQLEFDEPLANYDASAIHLKHKVDTLWEEIPYIFEPIEGRLRAYRLLAEWRPEQEYELSIDSAAFTGIYGLHSKRIKESLKMRSLDEYGTLSFDLKAKKLPQTALVELLNTQDAPVYRAAVEKGRADFYFLKPGTYYARLICDDNANGIWDTGLYENKLQAEQVYYYPHPLEIRALWDMRQDWDLQATPLEKQKPLEITKQKPDTEKKKKSKNAERERQKRR